MFALLQRTQAAFTGGQGQVGVSKAAQLAFARAANVRKSQTFSRLKPFSVATTENTEVAIELPTNENDEELLKLRHTSAHVMAMVRFDLIILSWETSFRLSIFSNVLLYFAVFMMCTGSPTSFQRSSSYYWSLD